MRCLSAAIFIAVLHSASAFDYFIFSRRFAIHGLWNKNYNGTSPGYCGDDEFELGDISDLLPRMQLQWPSLYGSNFQFWHHEWQRHGTCSKNVFKTPHEFFSSVLDLNAKLDVAESFQGLAIGGGVRYSQVSLEQIISKQLGKQVRLHCQDGLLTELWSCVDKKLELTDCPANVATHCGSVQLPDMPESTSRGKMASLWIGVAIALAIVIIVIVALLVKYYMRPAPTPVRTPSETASAYSLL